MVHVIAPAALPAGYTFEAQIGGPSGGGDYFVPGPDEKSSSAVKAADAAALVPTFTVEVPEGGVRDGEMFLAPIPEVTLSKTGGRYIRPPTGRWKDGTLDLFKYGLFHPAFCCALWCTQSEFFFVFRLYIWAPCSPSPRGGFVGPPLSLPLFGRAAKPCHGVPPPRFKV